METIDQVRSKILIVLQEYLDHLEHDDYARIATLVKNINPVDNATVAAEHAYLYAYIHNHNMSGIKLYAYMLLMFYLAPPKRAGGDWLYNDIYAPHHSRGYDSLLP